MSENKIPFIKVKALWKGFNPDCRPYKPSTPQIEFPEPLVIVVDIPVSVDLVANGDVIATAQLANQEQPKPEFTPLGMRYIIDQFEDAMKNGEHGTEEETAKTDDEDWGDEEKADHDAELLHDDKKSVKFDDEEWNDEEETKESEEDKPWEEDWNE